MLEPQTTTTSRSHSIMAQRLADRLTQARQRRFVGREQECSLFESALGAEEFGFCVFYVYGPGGVGKTTLLGQFADIAQRRRISCIHVDGRDTEPSSDAFIQALQRSLGTKQDEPIFQAFESSSSKTVLLIDTYEKLTPLDDWLRDVFLPQLPESVLTVLAGRNEPSAAWRIDAGWQTLIRTVPLRNLSPAESKKYLRERHVPTDQHDNMLKFTRGHPLALSLVADAVEQRPEQQFHPDEAPDIVRTLLEHFIQKVPGPAHRTALEVCALVHLTTESLLAEMLQIPNALELFDWLRGLSFIESGRTGLFPHDLVRDALISELRWRNPEWYAELHHRAREYYKKRMLETRGEEQRLILIDYVFLHRLNPVIQPAIEWQERSNVWIDAMHEADVAKLVAMVRAHEGNESSKIAEYYLTSVVKRRVASVSIFRDAHQEPAGFLLILSLHELTKVDTKIDTACKKALDFLAKKAPLRAGERAVFFRFWMARENYQAFSPIQSSIFTNVFQYYFSTPGLAYSFFPVADGPMWTPLFSYAELQPIPEVDFELEGKHYFVFGHDWRTMPLAQWLEVLGQKEMGMTPTPIQPPVSEQVVVLSETSFAVSVRDALRNISQPDLLLGNPLLSSRLVLDALDGEATDETRIDALARLAKQAVESLQASPRDAKLHRVLYRTFLNPADSQELAAETLNLPFSTYRRYLKSGIARVTEFLWKRETKSSER